MQEEIILLSQKEEEQRCKGLCASLGNCVYSTVLYVRGYTPAFQWDLTPLLRHSEVQVRRNDRHRWTQRVPGEVPCLTP